MQVRLKQLAAESTGTPSSNRRLFPDVTCTFWAAAVDRTWSEVVVLVPAKHVRLAWEVLAEDGAGPWTAPDCAVATAFAVLHRVQKDPLPAVLTPEVYDLTRVSDWTQQVLELGGGRTVTVPEGRPTAVAVRPTLAEVRAWERQRQKGSHETGSP